MPDTFSFQAVFVDTEFGTTLTVRNREGRGRGDKVIFEIAHSSLQACREVLLDIVDVQRLHDFLGAHLAGVRADEELARRNA